MDNLINTLCISGGGIKGISFISALDILIKHIYLDLTLINTFVGTSFGAIFCFLFLTQERVFLFLITYLVVYFET